MSRAEFGSFLEVALEVLQRSKRPMKCREIIDAAQSRGLLLDVGKTPTKTLYASLVRNIRLKGSKSDFRLVGKAQFMAARSRS